MTYEEGRMQKNKGLPRRGLYARRRLQCNLPGI